jgi:hypothetical protein
LEVSKDGRDQKMNAQYNAHQRCYAQTIATPPDEVMDNVQETLYGTEVTFWERNASLRPLPDSLVLYGQFSLSQDGHGDQATAE